MMDNPPGQRLLAHQAGGLADPVHLRLCHLGLLIVDVDRLLDLEFTERHYPGHRATVEGALVYPGLLLDRLLQPTALSFAPVVVVGASLLGTVSLPGSM